MPRKAIFSEPVFQENVIKLFARDILSRTGSYKDENDKREDVESILPLEVWLHIMLIDPAAYLLLAYTCRSLRMLAMSTANMKAFNTIFMFRRTEEKCNFEHIYRPCVCGHILGYSRSTYKNEDSVTISYSDHNMNHTLCKRKKLNGDTTKVIAYMDQQFSYTYLPIKDKHLAGIYGDRTRRVLGAIDKKCKLDIDPLKNGGCYIELMSLKTIEVEREVMNSRRAINLFCSSTDRLKFRYHRPYAHACVYWGGVLIAEVIGYCLIPTIMLYPNRRFLGSKYVVEQRYYYEDHVDVKFIHPGSSIDFRVKDVDDITEKDLFLRLSTSYA